MQMRSVITTAGLLSVVLLPTAGAVSPDAASPIETPSRVPVAIAQPLAAMDRGPLVGMATKPSDDAMLPESGMLVLVGSALLGLASVVRRTTTHS